MNESISLKFAIGVEDRAESVFSQAILEKSGLKWVPKFGWSVFEEIDLNDQGTSMIHFAQHYDHLDRKTYWSSLIRPGYDLEPLVFHRGQMMCTDSVGQFIEEMAWLYEDKIRKLLKPTNEEFAFSNNPFPWSAHRRFWRCLIGCGADECVINPHMVAVDLSNSAETPIYSRLFQNGVTHIDCLECFSQPAKRISSALVKIETELGQEYFSRHWFEFKNQGWSFDIASCRDLLERLQKNLSPQLLHESIAKAANIESKSMRYIPSWVDLDRDVAGQHVPPNDRTF